MKSLPVDFVGFLERETPREKVFTEAKAPAVRELALWDEILECEEANRPKPEWARLALIAYIKEQYTTLKHREQQQLLWDYRAFELVTIYLKEKHKPKSAKRPRKFSLRRACGRAAMELYPKQEITPELIQNVRRAYERALKRNKEGFYASSTFLKMSK